MKYNPIIGTKSNVQCIRKKLYFKTGSGLKRTSLFFISDDLTYDTGFVHCLQRKLTEHIKEQYPEINHLSYFFDGCAGQYKNYKNFINLTYHYNDFGLTADWSFFATSHGKSVCDGIGGCVKRKFVNASFAASPSNKITCTQSAYDYCLRTMSKISFSSSIYRI